MKQGLSVLAIDDDHADLALLRHSFSEIHDFDIHLHEALDWQEALRILQNAPIDIILVDYFLNGKNGVNVLEMMRRDGIEHPVIIITGQPNDRIAIEALQAGASDFLIKGTLTPRDLVRTLMNVAQRERLNAQIREHERHRSELAENHQRLLNMVENLPAGAVYVEGNTLTFNKAATLITGYAKGELKTREAWFNALHGEKAAFCRARYEENKRTGFKQIVRVPIIHKSGATRNVEFALYGADNVEVWLIQDRTDEMRLESERQQLEQRLRQLEKLESLGSLAGGIAHDFNNLLNVIQGNTTLALDSLDTPEEMEGSLLDIREATQQAIKLTKQMLHFSGRGKFQAEEIDLNLLIENLVPTLRTVAGNIVLDYQPSRESTDIQGDADLLRQVLMNLATNSMEAIGNREGRIAIRTGFEQLERDTATSENLYAKPGDYATVVLTDTGIGMNEETRSKIFDPFFSTKGVGRGLGLAAVLGILRAHNGFCNIDSQPNHGTTFTIYLPMPKSYSSQQRSATSVHDPAEEWLKDPKEGNMSDTKTVLVIDDEPGIRRLAERILSRAGYDILLAEDGSKGVEVYRTNVGKIDGLLIDLSMPGFGGMETLRRIREINPDAKAVMSSGYSEDGIHESDCVDFILKPYTPKDLVATIKKMLGEDS